MNFKVKYKISACGGVLTGSEFVLTSPGYPENYPNDIDCVWVVSVPLGAAVKVSILRRTKYIEKKRIDRRNTAATHVA